MKPVSQLIRLFLTIHIYNQLFNQSSITYHLCGPLTIKPANQLFKLIILIQSLKFIYPFTQQAIMKNFQLSLLELPVRLITIKYIIILAIKLFIIFYQSHRWAYYCHLIFLQIIMIMLCIILDVMNHRQIGEVGEIIVLDTFHIIVTTYQLTRTFCPNFAIYWFIVNFFVLAINQVEGYCWGQRAILYVKYDLYRIFLLMIFYFGCFSIVQIPYYGYKMIFFFGASFLFLKTALDFINQSQYTKAIIYLVIATAVIVMVQIAYQQYKMPFFHQV